MVRELRTYQQEALDFAEAAGNRWVYADAAGTGKTPTTVTWLQGVTQGTRGPALVVCPNAVADQWLQTVANWTEMEPLDLRGTPAQRADARQTLQNGVCGVLSYELLRVDRLALRGVAWGAVAFDEAHRLKGRENQTAKAARALKSPAAAMLTGTPLLNSAEELWMLLHMARPKQYPAYRRWLHEHFYTEITDFHGKLPKPIELVIGLRPGHDELLREEAQHVMLWRDIDTLLPGLPPVTNHIVDVELGPEERALYDSIAKKGWGRHGTALIETTNAVSKMTRLHQITSEWNKVAEALDHGAKTQAGIDLLLPTTEQAVVLCGYKAQVDALSRVVHGVRYTGDESPKERRRNVEKFKLGDAQFIVGTIAAMGEGLDGLQVASRMVRLDRDWTPARNDQIIGRIRRSGQLADRLDVVDVVAADTVDQDVAQALARKTAVVDALRY